MGRESTAGDAAWVHGVVCTGFTSVEQINVTRVRLIDEERQLPAPFSVGASRLELGTSSPPTDVVGRGVNGWNVRWLQGFRPPP
jgi:hypothetical protein